MTQMPRPGSPALDATPCDPAILIDQRNIPRPSGAACDLGAVELSPLTFSVSLAATPAKVNVGVQTLPISNIPTSVLATAYPAASTSSTADTTLARIALAGAHPGPDRRRELRVGRHRTGADHARGHHAGAHQPRDTALARILITEINVEGGWEALLVGTALANVPLQTLTMADVLADPVAGPRLQSLDLSKLDVSSTLLGEIPLVLFAFAGQTFNTLPPDSSSSVPALDQWAAILAVPAADLSGRTPCRPCSPAPTSPMQRSPASLWPGSICWPRRWHGSHSPASMCEKATLARITLARIDLANTALARITLARIEINAATLTNITLARITLARINIAGSGLANISLGGLSSASLATFIDCTKVNCATGTLGQAAASGAILSTATIATLILALQGTTAGAQVGDLLTAANQAMTADGIELADLLRLLAGSPLAGYTMADLFPALFADADLPWQDIDLEATPLQNLGSPLVAPATFTTTITVANATPDVSVSLTLPPGFAAVPGSANFDANGSAAPAPVALALPAVTVAGATLTFSLGAVPPGTHTLDGAGTRRYPNRLRRGNRERHGHPWFPHQDLLVHRGARGRREPRQLVRSAQLGLAVRRPPRVCRRQRHLHHDVPGHPTAGGRGTQGQRVLVEPLCRLRPRGLRPGLGGASRSPDRGHHPRRRPSDRCGSDLRVGCARLPVRHSALRTSRLRPRRSVRQPLEQS